MKKSDYIEAEDYYEIGCQWTENKNYTKAIDAFRHVLSLNPKFMYAYIDLAYVCAKSGRYNEAVQVLKKGSRIDPDFHKLYYLMAKYYFRDGNYGGALKSIEKAVEYSDEKLYRLVHQVVIRKYKSSISG
ncbi:MAG TPA: tetratricopeptide repeat protein [Spirochaetota bacterium]|mgnify:CR=1 FL=1|nr:tetratricopeptide repeat protein [Spirochaetota bacterium]